MTLAAVNTPEAVEPAGRRTVANIVAEIEGQRAGYLAAMRVTGGRSEMYCVTCSHAWTLPGGRA